MYGLQFKGTQGVTVFGVAVSLIRVLVNFINRVSQQHRICLDIHLKKVLLWGEFVVSRVSEEGEGMV